MSKKYFGTDGVRGEVGKPPMTPDFVMRLGYVTGQVLATEATVTQHPAVLIGKDTRLSGYMFEAALEAGFSAAGVDVSLVGPLPTPGVAYLTRTLRLQAGVVISASHNPFGDNGIKFFSASGTKLPDAVEHTIEAALSEGADKPIVCASQQGHVHRIDDATGRYIEFCKRSFPNHLSLRGLKIVVDCAHGAAYHVAPDVFHELGAEVVSIGTDPDGLNINKACGATTPTTLCETVRAEHADLGIALDGDGDRVIMADAEGRVYDGDQVLYAIVKSQSNVKGVVGTLMSNLAFEHALKRLHIPFERAPVGDRYVTEMLLEKGWCYGGENSGHILCLEHHSTGDGVIAALQVLKALREADSTLPAYTEELTLYPQKLCNIQVPGRFDWQACAPVRGAIADAEHRLAGHGRVLIRPSGTEPVLRLMVEGNDVAEVERLADDLAALIEAESRRQVPETG